MPNAKEIGLEKYWFHFFFLLVQLQPLETSSENLLLYWKDQSSQNTFEPRSKPQIRSWVEMGEDVMGRCLGAEDHISSFRTNVTKKEARMSVSWFHFDISSLAAPHVLRGTNLGTPDRARTCLINEGAHRWALHPTVEMSVCRQSGKPRVIIWTKCHCLEIF